jgi:hypothetical protein
MHMHISCNSAGFRGLQPNSSHTAETVVLYRFLKQAGRTEASKHTHCLTCFAELPLSASITISSASTTH